MPPLDSVVAVGAAAAAAVGAGVVCCAGTLGNCAVVGLLVVSPAASGPFVAPALLDAAPAGAGVPGTSTGAATAGEAAPSPELGVPHLGLVTMMTTNFFSSMSYSLIFESSFRIFPAYINFWYCAGYSFPFSTSIFSLNTFTVSEGSISTLKLCCCNVFNVTIILVTSAPPECQI
uniref:Uncharacterized protein n=1 Tax=Ixodes ricinus TaxID=34613 RepID=A0A6B0UZF5_IXORI